MTRKLEDAQARHKRGESQRHINSIANRKSANQGTIKGKSSKIEYGNGLSSLKTCLGKIPGLAQENDDANLVNVLHDVQMNDGDLMMEEMRKVKEKIFE